MIEGRLVRLRALSAEDLDAHFRWRNDPEVVHWATGDNPYFDPSAGRPWPPSTRRACATTRAAS